MPYSIRVVVTVQQTEEEIDRAAACVRDAAVAVLGGNRSEPDLDTY